MGYPDSFTGFMIEDQKKWTDFKKQEFKPKPFQSRDIDVEITACGVCGSDVHTINGGWGDCPLPICVGHEVIGKAIRVGDQVTTVKVGDRVGVGAQIRACLQCKPCKAGQENYCPDKVDTYGAPYPDLDNVIAQGGYSSHIRAHEYFTFPIPEAIPDTDAGPLMCAGLTVWSPLVRAKVGPGKKVGIIGVGGLGHFAVLFSAALGATVTAISHSANKEADARSLGARSFINTAADPENWHKGHEFEFDYLLNAADMTHHFDLKQYLATLDVNGEMHHVGLPDGPLQTMMAQDFTTNGCKMGASHIGNREEMLGMLKFVAEKKLKPIVQTLDISAENCAKAVSLVEKNDVRYRFCLTGFDKAFKGA